LAEFLEGAIIILLLTAAPFALLAGCSSGDQADTPADDSMTATEVPAEPMGTTTDGTIGTETDTGAATGTAETGTTGTGTGTGTRTGPDTTPPTDTSDK
jgi:hypothetical protein